MVTACVRSLSCRLYGVVDAVVAPSPAKKGQALPLLSVSCATAAEVRDSLELVHHDKKQRPRPERRKVEQEQQHETRPRPKKKPKQFMPSPVAALVVSSAFLMMAELPEGHSSRQVVELIFLSGWGMSSPAPEVEAMFRVHNASRAVVRFEDARTAAREHGAALRCGTHGNEMMCF